MNKFLNWMRYKSVIIVAPLAAATMVAFMIALFVSYVEINKSKFTKEQVYEQAVASAKATIRGFFKY